MHTLVLFFSYLLHLSVSAEDRQPYHFTDGSTHTLKILFLNPATQQVICVDNKDIIQQKPLQSFKPSHHETLKKQTATKENTSFQQYHKTIWRNGKAVTDSPNTYPPPPPLGWQLVGWNTGNRNSIMSFNQTDYGNKAGSCVPNSLLNTLEWWNDTKIIEIPQQRTREKQIDWLQTELNRAANTRNSGTYWDDLKIGVNKFSEEELDGKYHFHCIEVPCPNLNQLVHYTQGNAAVCLSPTIYYGRKNGGGHGITLVKAEPTGQLQLNTWGLKLAAKFEDITDPKSPDKKRYELKILTPEDLLPNWFVRDEIRFIMETESHDSAYIFLPYQRQLPNTKYIPHPESAKPFTPETPKPTPAPSPRTTNTPHPFTAPTDFTSFKLRAKPLETNWTSTNGKTTSATLKFVSPETITITKGYKTYKIPKKSLIPTDILKAELWNADHTTNVLPPTAATYLYELAKNGKPLTTITIKSDGKNNAILTTSSPDNQHRFDKREFHFDLAQQRLAIYEAKSKKLLALHKGANTAYQWDKLSQRAAKPLGDWEYQLVNRFPSRYLPIEPISVREPAHLHVAFQSTPVLCAILANVFKSTPDIEKQIHPTRSSPTSWTNYSPHRENFDNDLSQALETASLLPTKLQWHPSIIHTHPNKPTLTLTLQKILPPQPIQTNIPRQ